jgi:uncharacterized protein
MMANLRDLASPLLERGESGRDGREDFKKAISPRYLILILTRRCNLSCKYCYNGEAEGTDMSSEVMDAAFGLLSESQGPFHAQLTGGEPGMAPELILMALKKAGEFSLKSLRPGTVALQTNGTLLSRELILEIKKRNLEVGISLDGPPDVNERVRGGSVGLLKGLDLLKESSIPFNVTTVVSDFNCARLMELPLFLAPYPGLRGVGLDLLVRKGRGEASSPKRDSLREAAKRLYQSLNMVNSLRKNPIVLRELELVKRACAKGPRSSFCEAHRAGSVAVDPSGRLFPCGQAAGDESLSMGTVFEPKAPGINFGDYNLSGPHCEGCPLKGRCPGECPSRLYFNNGENPPLVCELYRGLFEAMGWGG